MLGQSTGNFRLIRLTTAQTPGSHHLPPYSILCASSRHLYPNGFLSQDSQREVPKLSRFELLSLCKFVTFCSDLGLGWGLKQTSSEIANLSPSLSFCHNLCCRCPNGSCEPIFYIYTSIAFQWYKERLNAKCFDPCNQTLKCRESWRTPKSQFRECKSHPPTPSKWGCDKNPPPSQFIPPDLSYSLTNSTIIKLLSNLLNFEFFFFARNAKNQQNWFFGVRSDWGFKNSGTMIYMFKFPIMFSSCFNYA